MTMPFDVQALRDEFCAARRSASQRACWDANDPGAPPDTCRYCGKFWRHWSGSQLDGHATCVVDDDFKQHVMRILRSSPLVTFSAVAAAMGVTISVVRAWCAPMRLS
jgi:hypothetical protein